MKVLKAGLIQLFWSCGGWWWWRNQSGGWIIILSNLIIRDLKVSNLLMTDKGCVKIGESPPPSLRAPLQLLLRRCRAKTHSNICATIWYLRIHFSQFSHMVHPRLKDWENTRVSIENDCHLYCVCWRDCFCFQLILGWPGCMGFHSSPWPPEWSHYGEWNLLLIDICSRCVKCEQFCEYLILH